MADSAIREYDYVIVGGGTAGCVLASRLSEDRTVTVLLIERGASYPRMLLGVPLAGMKFIAGHMERVQTTEQEHCLNRRLDLLVGRVIGGGSSVNAMLYVRGDAAAYDRWAASGARGWSFQSVLPYFRKFENFETGAGAYHGADGPVGVSHSRYRSRFGSAFVEACRERGLAHNDDFSGATLQGAGFYQFTQERGARSAAAGYPGLSGGRPNLRVWSRTRVDDVTLEGNCAVGVRGVRDGRAFDVRARREVILAAGAFGTPRLLLRSGIGPADELRALGIDARVDLRSVGRGLQDHPRCPVLFGQSKPVPLGIPSLVGPFLRWCLARDGLFTSTTIAAGAFLKLDPASEVVDCQLAAKWAGSPPHRDAVDFQPCMMDVESRGYVRLTSADPGAPLAINPNFLATPREVRVLVDAIRLARDLAATKALRDFGLLDEIRPGPSVKSDTDLDRYVRSTVETAYHPSATCAMGTGPDAVVDPELRVYGVERLRIADASIMPSLVNGNTNGPTLMIAEKAADIIRLNG